MEHLCRSIGEPQAQEEQAQGDRHRGSGSRKCNVEQVLAVVGGATDAGHRPEDPQLRVGHKKRGSQLHLYRPKVVRSTLYRPEDPQLPVGHRGGPVAPVLPNICSVNPVPPRRSPAARWAPEPGVGTAVENLSQRWQ
jgi:hypothetical protein